MNTQFTSVALSFAQNFHGHLKPSIIDDISNFISSPSLDGWQNIKHYIISTNRATTIWQAVDDVDKSFRTGLVTDEYGNIISRPQAFPDANTVVKAISKCVFENSISLN